MLQHYGCKHVGWVHTLDLNYCGGITDVSMLGSVHTLNYRYGIMELPM